MVTHQTVSENSFSTLSQFDQYYASINRRIRSDNLKRNPARQLGIDSVFGLMDGGTKATSDGSEWGPGHLPFSGAPGRMWLESTTVGFSENAAFSCHSVRI